MSRTTPTSSVSSPTTRPTRVGRWTMPDFNSFATCHARSVPTSTHSPIGHRRRAFIIIGLLRLSERWRRDLPSTNETEHCISVRPKRFPALRSWTAARQRRQTRFAFAWSSSPCPPSPCLPGNLHRSEAEGSSVSQSERAATSWLKPEPVGIPPRYFLS